MYSSVQSWQMRRHEAREFGPFRLLSARRRQAWHGDEPIPRDSRGSRSGIGCRWRRLGDSACAVWRISEKGSSDRLTGQTGYGILRFAEQPRKAEGAVDKIREDEPLELSYFEVLFSTGDTSPCMAVDWHFSNVMRSSGPMAACGRILAAELPTWCAGRVGVRREAGACRQAGQCGWGVGGWSMDDFSIGTMAGASVVVNGEAAMRAILPTSDTVLKGKLVNAVETRLERG